jgi:exopolysaccharide biosynthesis predicted pyruvyltransferase EpsI
MVLTQKKIDHLKGQHVYSISKNSFIKDKNRSVCNKPLISLENFKKVFSDFKNKKIGFVVMGGKVGDFLIEDSAVQLFRYFGIDFRFVNNRHNLNNFNEKICGEVDEFVINGGGNMGSKYVLNQNIRKKLLKYSKPITVLPQTFTDRNENINYKKVWIRERESLRFKPDAELAPDLSLGYTFNREIPKPEKDIGIFLRDDEESIPFDILGNMGDPIRVCKTPEEYLLFAAKYKKIVTNRLHFAIAGLIAKREVILLPNNYFKNKSMYDTWLKYFSCKWNPFWSKDIAITNLGF